MALIVAVSSSWLIINGDVGTFDGRRPNGRKKGPRKKRGKPISDAARQAQLHKIECARERRRGGFEINSRR